jgi:hypothetical protein
MAAQEEEEEETNAQVTGRSHDDARKKIRVAAGYRYRDLASLLLVYRQPGCMMQG